MGRGERNEGELPFFAKTSSTSILGCSPISTFTSSIQANSHNMASSFPETTSAEYKLVNENPSESAELLVKRCEDPPSATSARNNCEEEGEESAFSEWRIRVHGIAVFEPKRFQSSDFRDFRTGESVLPAEIYGKLVNEIFAHRNVANYMSSAFLVVLYFAFIFSPRLISTNDTLLNWGWVFYGYAGMLAFALGIASVVLPRIYQKLDSEIQERVDDRRKDLLQSYGVELGYHPNTKPYRFWNDDSHVWLRRPRRQQPEDERGSTHTLPEEFPPIYLVPLVPGDISVYEQVYHPSMKLDEETWKLIQKSHKEGAKGTPIIAFLTSVLWLSFCLYCMFFVSIMNTIGGWQALCGIFLYFCVVYVFVLWVHQQPLKWYQQVAETVTRILNNEETKDNVNEDALHEDEYTFKEQMAGYSLELKTSPLPGRPDAISRRYQLVRRTTVGKASSRAYSLEEATNDASMDYCNLQIV
jgi:protein-S-isoprenylcysteine O-methyltransferase Ste14